LVGLHIFTLYHLPKHSSNLYTFTIMLIFYFAVSMRVNHHLYPNSSWCGQLANISTSVYSSGSGKEQTSLPLHSA